jgi:polyisoprenyl-phosphate glycosyltransferase
MEAQATPIISIIVPMYNEALNALPFYSAVTGVMDKIEHAFELIFVNDGSSDDTQLELEKLAAKDKNVKIIDFARNFGKEIAVTAGLHESSGDAAIIIDADLQHPVAKIHEFIRAWERGAEVVVGVREGSGHYESHLKAAASKTFYKIMNKLSETDITPHSTDFRLLDRVVIDEFCRFTERNRMTRGLIDWLGFKRDYVYFTADKRHLGEASYSLRKLIGLASNSFVSNSLFPLKLAGYLGAIITIVSGLAGSFVIVEKYILGDPLSFRFSGPAILGLLTMFLVGVILACLGLIALYIANIHAESTNRPLYVVRRTRAKRITS